VAELPDPLGVRSLRIHDLLLVEANGRLEARTVAQLASALQVPGGVSAVLLDLSGLWLLDTIAADVLVAEHRRLEEGGIRMALLCPPGEARRALDLAGVTRVVPAFADPDAALDAACWES